MSGTNDAGGIQILLVEDDRRVRGRIEGLVEALNRSEEVDVSIAMECATSGREALDHLADFYVDVILLDLSLPDVHGIGAISQIAKSLPHVPIIVLTNICGWATMVQCAEAGGRDYLVKNDLDSDTLFRSIYYAYERKQVEDRLRQSQAVYRSLVEHLPVGIFRKDTRGRYEFVNQAFCDAVGLTVQEIKRHCDADLFSDPDAAELELEERDLFKSGKWSETERTLKTTRGKKLDARMIKIPLLDAEEEEICGIQGILHDISSQKLSEEQRHMEERCAGMESLSGAIAHHVSNRLAPVMLNASIIESRTEDPEVVKASQKIGESASKAGQIVRHLFAMTKQREGKKIPVEMDLILNDLPRFVKEQISEGVTVDLRMTKGLQNVHGEFGPLKQLLEQLCTNASEAMNHQGRITVTATNTSHGLSSADDHSELKRVPAISIRVSDTGPGVPGGIRNRIFDSHFTTKDVDFHKGIGLAQCMSVARNHHSVLRLLVDTRVGATFELIMPALITDSNSFEPVSSISTGNDSKTILLVDDEEPTLEAAQVVLEENGFKVITASDGAQAIVKFGEQARDINLVLTDLRMPHMDGAALSQAIHSISPAMPILVSTGIDSKENLDRLEDLGICEVIPKPFAPKQLVQRIRQELSTAQA